MICKQFLTWDQQKIPFIAGRPTLFDRNRDAGGEISRWIRYQHLDACGKVSSEKFDFFLERSSVRIKLCTIMYNYLCIYITHNTYNIYIYPYMDHIWVISNAKKKRNTLGNNSTKKIRVNFPTFTPRIFHLMAGQGTPPLWETNGLSPDDSTRSYISGGGVGKW